MTATLTTKQIKDGAGSLFLQRVVDVSGTGAGPFLPILALSDAAGGGPLDLAALAQSIVDAARGAPRFDASAVTAVTGTISAAGVTAALSPDAGRAAYLWLSGGISASGVLQFSNDGGTSWFALAAEGTTIGTFGFAAANGGQLVIIPVPEQASVKVRARFAAVSGTVSYTLSQ